MTSPRVRIGVSACLLGQRVRYDGGHKRDAFLLDRLGRHVEWVPVCPEMEAGLGAPRPSMRLVASRDGPRLVTRDGADLTDRMRTWSEDRATSLGRERLHGFVLKKDSPSCGVFRVKLHQGEGRPAERKGRGLFADEITRRHPLLPVEEEGRLADATLRENFVERVFAYQRWTRQLDHDPTPRGLVAFHTVHKFTILSHSPGHYRRLGRLVARAGDGVDVSSRYAALFMEALAVHATRGRHVNVLQHLAGFVKDTTTPGDRSELAAAVADYREGHVPLVVPLTLLRHLLRRGDAAEWAVSQTYLSPYPRELMLRNHV